jgi:DNA-binding transcriptional ArsR family regulator
MKEGPDIALVASLIGDPARANMLTALLSGKALTATELATEGGITPQTASSHLKKLESADLITTRKQGRHKYFALADEEVGRALEALMGLAAKRGLLRTKTGPRDPELRKARICYNHLAGDLGVKLYDGLLSKGLLVDNNTEVHVTDAGAQKLSAFGLAFDEMSNSRRPMCLSCLDWSERRTHLAGSLGSALLQRFYDLGWAKRLEGTRIIRFSPKGEKEMLTLFGQ